MIAIGIISIPLVNIKFLEVGKNHGFEVHTITRVNDRIVVFAVGGNFVKGWEGS